MVDREVVERLLGHLAGYLKDLETVQHLSLSEYSSDIKTSRFVERTLQIAIEASLDIGWHIIADEGLSEAENNKDVFRVLADAGIISRELLPNLQQMASFRNLVVHDYGKINDELVFGILKRRLGDFESYARSIVKYLQR